MSYLLHQVEPNARASNFYFAQSGGGGGGMLSLTGDTLAISGGNSVDLASATTVAATADKTQKQSYNPITSNTVFTCDVAASNMIANDFFIDTGMPPFTSVGNTLATLTNEVGNLQTISTFATPLLSTIAYNTQAISYINPSTTVVKSDLSVLKSHVPTVTMLETGTGGGATVSLSTILAIETNKPIAIKAQVGTVTESVITLDSQSLNTNGDIQIYKSSPPTYRQVNTANGESFEIVTNVETAMGSSGPLIMKGNNNLAYEARLTLDSETATLSSSNVPKIALLKNSTGATASLAINESNNTIISSSGSLALEPAGATASIKTPNAIFVAGDLTGAHNSYKLEVNDALASASLGKSTGNQLTINDSYVALKGANPSATIGIGDVDGFVNGCKIEVDLATNSTTISAGGAPQLTASTAGVTVSRLIETSLQPYPTTYYVSKSGNDTTGSGSQSNPFLTIQKAITVAEAAGSVATIFINTGSYTEDLIITKNISLIGIDLNIALKDSVSSPTVNNVEIIGGITNNPVVAGAFTAQYITFTVPVNKQIVYNSASAVGQMNFQYCTITGTTALNDGLSLILTNRHTHWFSNCRISKISATIGVPTIDGGTSSQASLFIISECRVQTRSSTDGIRAGAVQIYDSIVTAASGGTIIRLSGSSTTNSIISASQLQMNTVAGTFITNEKTVAVTIQMYNSQFLSFTALTGGLHYLVNNTSASSVALWFSNNKFFQSAGTPLNSTQMYTGLITFVDGVDIRPINMVDGNIINVSNITNATVPLAITTNNDPATAPAVAVKNLTGNCVLDLEPQGGKGGQIIADEGAGAVILKGRDGFNAGITGTSLVAINTEDNASAIGMTAGPAGANVDIVANGDDTGRIALIAQTSGIASELTIDGSTTTGIITAKSDQLVLDIGGSVGTAGQSLISNGSSAVWADNPLVWGSFLNTSSITLTASVVTSAGYDTTVTASNCTRTGSSIVITKACSKVRIQSSLIASPSNPDTTFRFWLIQNSTAVPNSQSIVTLKAAADKILSVCEWYVSAAVNDTFTVLCLVDKNSSLYAEAAAGARPACPSIITTVTGYI